LRASIERTDNASDLVELLQAVDAALDRLDSDHFERCDVCGLRIYDEELLAHPTIQYCLCELSDQQLAALELDLALARRTQLALLPPQDLALAAWQVHFRYQPAGPVSGDYLDVIQSDVCPFFLLGDVSGKGVAASLLMARLSALVRGLIEQRLPVED